MRDARGTVMNIHTAGCVFVIIAKAGLCWQLPLERASYLVLASPQSPGDFSVPLSLHFPDGDSDQKNQVICVKFCVTQFTLLFCLFTPPDLRPSYGLY